MGQVVWRHWLLVLLVTAGAIGGGVVYLRIATPLYTSVSRILAEPARPRVLGDSPPPVSSDEAAAFLSNQRAMISSVPVLTEVLNTPAGNVVRAAAGDRDPLEHLQKKLRVTIGRKDNLISVEYDAIAPESAALVVRSAVEAYIDLQKRQHRAITAELLAVLEQQRAQCDAVVLEKRRAIREVQRAAGTVTFDNAEGTVPRTLQALKEALIVARVDTSSAQSLYEEARAACRPHPEQMRRIEEIERSATSELGPEADGVQLRAAIGEAEQQLQDAIAGNSYGENHPRIRGMRQRIDQLRAMQVVALKRRAASLKLREASLEEQVRRQEELARAYAESGAKFASLDAELKQAERQLETLENRIREVRSQQDAGLLNINVLEPASVGRRPAKPVKSQVLAIGGVAGVFLGVCCAFLRELTDRRLRSALQARHLINVPVLGIVPCMSRRQGETWRAQVVRTDPYSAPAEAFRSIRTAVSHSRGDGPPRRLLVTASESGEGASTVVSNLAISLAQAGRRVLIIDANLRHPSQHRIFGLGEVPGLTSILSGDEPVETMVRRTTIEALDVLPCGLTSGCTPELLLNSRMVEMLDRLSSRYDIILLDSPATVAFSEARSLSPLCDGTMLVLRLGSCDRVQAMRACEGLLGVGAGLLGAVLTGARGKNMDSGYFELPAMAARESRQLPGGIENAQGEDVRIRQLPLRSGSGS